jgi:hypothetical protein
MGTKGLQKGDNSSVFFCFFGLSEIIEPHGPPLRLMEYQKRPSVRKIPDGE